MSAPERVPPGGVTPPETVGETATALAHGELTVHGRIPDASNGVLYCTVHHEGRRLPCVYKPVRAERPLWDFPDGTLAEREVAAYEVSEATGWHLIPTTVLRDGPFGRGMCQAWVGPSPHEEADPPPDRGSGPAADRGVSLLGPAGEAGLLALVDGEEPEPGWKAVGLAATGEGRTALLVHRDDARLRRLAVLDAVINNGDRKGRHLLPAGDRLYGIDHGVSFHTDDKLRTLLWGWAGEPLPEEALRVLRRLAAGLADGAPLAARLGELLTAAELAALRRRVARLLDTGRHPLPGGDWPAIPWPPV